MEELGQIAHILQGRLRNRARRLQRLPGARVRLETSKRYAHIHLNGDERLADRVVQLPGDGAPLLFLRGHDRGRQPFKLAPVLLLGQALAFDFLLESTHAPC